MPAPRNMRKWFSLPSRVALMLGLGALSAAGAKSDAATLDQANPARIPQTSVKNFGELQVWSDGGRIFLSEAGAAPRELTLGDTADAARLRQLLERDGATAASPQVLQHRLILVGGGGDGFHWSQSDRQTTSQPAGGSDASGASTTSPADKAGSSGNSSATGLKG